MVSSLWIEEIETKAGITAQIHNEGFKDSPIPEAPGAFVVFEGGDEGVFTPKSFQKRETEGVSLWLPRNFPFLKRP